MNLVPKTVSRFGHRSLLKINASSPTILVVAGVIGLGATAVMAAKATRKIDPVLDEHKQARAEIGYSIQTREQQTELVRLYAHTGFELTKIYGPTIFVGTTSAIAVLGGHKILRTRHAAALSAYSGLMEQFTAYRKRIAQTLGKDMEQDIYNGAHGEHVEDPDHPGEYKLKPKWDGTNDPNSYLRPWFDETNVNWSRNAENNYLFLKGVQNHFNRLLNIHGHVFLNDVLRALNMPDVSEGQIVGWLYDSDRGDRYIDFGFMTSDEPHTVAFRNGVERTVRLNFNVDGPVWDKI
jgi:hypothetical protein